MKPLVLLAFVSKQYLQTQNITRYRMKRIDELSDDEVIRICHCYCEENNQTGDFAIFRNKIESEYRYCSVTQEFIEEGMCTDIQMIKEGYIKKSVLADYDIDFSKAESECERCRYSFY